MATSSTSPSAPDPPPQPPETAQDRQNRSDVQTATYLAYITTLLFFAIVLIIIFRGVGPADQTGTPIRDLLFTLLGVVATGWATIIGYYYGSSSGSAQKTLALAQALRQRGERGTPAVQLIKPNPLTRRPEAQPVTLHGLNLDSVKSVQIVSPQGNTIDATDLHSSSTAITFDVVVGPNELPGDWDLRVFDAVGAGGTPTPFPKALRVV